MRQGNTESKNSYLKRFKANVQEVEPAKENHILYAQQLIVANNINNPTNNIIYNE